MKAQHLGDRSVLLLDGRETEQSHHVHAKAWAERYGYATYQLAYGTFSNPVRLSQVFNKGIP